MEIRPAINKPGMFCLVWNDNGIEGGEHFDRIETISTTRDEDATLWNGNVPGTTLHISPEALEGFYNQVNELDIQVHVTLLSSAKDGSFSGRVTTIPKVGMKAQIKTCCLEGKLHMGNEFTIASAPREFCGTWVVALNNEDGSRFSGGYDLSMLEITELGEAA